MSLPVSKSTVAPMAVAAFLTFCESRTTAVGQAFLGRLPAAHVQALTYCPVPSVSHLAKIIGYHVAHYNAGRRYSASDYLATNNFASPCKLRLNAVRLG